MAAGYEQLSDLMTKYPELTSLRKFRKLSIECLLYKQAEITWLEHELKRSRHRQSISGTLVPESWQALYNGSNEKEFEHQKSIMDQLSEKLPVFHSMLLQASGVFELANPQKADLANLIEVLDRQPDKDCVHGIECDAWTLDNKNDLATLDNNNTDEFAQIICNVFLHPYHSLVGKHRKASADLECGQIWEYKTRSFSIAANLICVAISSTLPTASTFALYYVKPMDARLGLISAFNFLFALAMMFIVGRRRGEVFAATAAFAAIQVVFVGGVNVL